MVDLTTRDRVTIALSIEEGRMPLTFFIHTVDDLRKLLSAIEEAQLGEASHTQWEVDTDRIQIAASVNGVSAEDLENIIHDAYQSLKATDAKDEESIPNSVNEQSRRLTRSIVNRVKRTVPVVLDVPGQDLVRIEANPQESYARPRVFHGRRREVITAWGAVDGELDMISVRRRAYFVIYEHGSNNQIRCTFPDDWMETVKDMLARRVIVEGNLRYRTDGTVRAVAEPSSINPVPEPRRTIIEFRGALPGISGELSSADYIKQLRAG